VNSAELGSSIDSSAAETELQAARNAVSKMEGSLHLPKKSRHNRASIEHVPAPRPPSIKTEPRFNTHQIARNEKPLSGRC